MTADPRFAPIPAVPRSPDEARARRLDDGLWALRLPLPYPVTRSVNAYLLEQEDGWCLVDCGTSLPPGWAALERALALAGVAPESISLLLLTHAHADHAGLAREASSRLGCRVAQLDAPWTLTDPLRAHHRPLEARRREALAAGVPGELVDVWTTAQLADDSRHVPADPDVLLHDGDTIPSRLGDWSVHPAPGHSPSQLMLFQPERRWLLSADAVLPTRRPYFENGTTPDPYLDYVGALERAAALDPVLLLPGHGPPLEDAAGWIRAAHDAGTALRAEFLALLAEGSATPYELSLRLIRHDADIDKRQVALSTALSLVQHLEGTGEAIVRTRDDGVRLVAARPEALR